MSTKLRLHRCVASNLCEDDETIPKNSLSISSNTVVDASRGGIASTNDRITITTGNNDGESSAILPQDVLNQKRMVAILAQELNRLSFVDRTNVQEEIHGVHSLMPEETSKMIEKALLDFSHQIRLFPPEKTAAYQQALSLNSQYVYDRDFRLKFIRADLYNIPMAVERFMAYLDVMVEHFGNDGLIRQILQSDLTRLEFEVMRKGGFQVLSSRDRAGRLVIVYHGVMQAEGLHMKSMVCRSQPSCGYWS
jgi:hypothetical protein